MIRYPVVLVCACWLAGCSDDEPQMEPTFPVSGIVQIDGKPTEGVRVMMFPADKIPDWVDPNLGALHQATTDAQGKFEITTYKTADGAPAGNYVVCFYWEGNPKVVPFANPDEPAIDPVAATFNRKYGNPAKSEIKPTVEEGKPTDLGTLQLTTR